MNENFIKYQTDLTKISTTGRGSSCDMFLWLVTEHEYDNDKAKYCSLSSCSLHATRSVSYEIISIGKRAVLFLFRVVVVGLVLIHSIDRVVVI